MAQKAWSRMIWSLGAVLLTALWTGTIGAQAPAQGSAAAQGSVRTIDNPGGGRIYLGFLPGQPTPQDAMGKTLHRLGAYCGDRPQLGRLVQNPGGEILAGFFTVNGKNQDGKPMAGLALVYAPKSGTAGGAVLIDYADRFPSTVNSMFARLKQELGKASTGAPAAQSQDGGPAPARSVSGGSGSGASASAPEAPAGPAAPAQPLQRVAFPDGTGSIGLPAGWQMLQAHMGDVNARGPHGEKLRFGLTVPVIDPSNPQSRTLMGNSRGGAPGQFVAIRYGIDPAEAFKSAMTQMARKAGKQPPDFEIAKVQDIPLQGGKNYFLYGNQDAHNGQGKEFFLAQMINTLPQQLGTWQMTLYVIIGPPQTMAEERSTLAAIYPSYSRDNGRVNAMANDQIRQSIEQSNQIIGMVRQYTDSGDRLTAGMSDLLREQTVIVDTETGGHARTSDQLAGMLMDANPNRFQSVSPSGYIPGIDY